MHLSTVLSPFASAQLASRPYACPNPGTNAGSANHWRGVLPAPFAAVGAGTANRFRPSWPILCAPKVIRRPSMVRKTL